MSGQCRVLLVETDDLSVGVIERYIARQFPHIEVNCASTPAATMELLERTSYDIIVCDAFLRHDERVSFIGKMCSEDFLFLIIITGDTSITAETFSPHVAKSCIHHVLYKPLDLKLLCHSIQCAIHRVWAEKRSD